MARPNYGGVDARVNVGGSAFVAPAQTPPSSTTASVAAFGPSGTTAVRRRGSVPWASGGGVILIIGTVSLGGLVFIYHTLPA